MTEARQRNIKITVLSLTVFMVLVLALFVNKILQPRVLSDKEMVNSGAIMFQTPREISPLQLIDKTGAPFNGKQLLGQWTLVFFGFTHCPDICPATLAIFNELSVELADSHFVDDTQFMLVSLDPERDTPEKLNTYVNYFNPNFLAVTGEFINIHRFATQLNVAFQKVMLGDGSDADNYTVDHSGNVALINPRGYYHGFFKPPFDTAKLALTYRSERMKND